MAALVQDRAAHADRLVDDLLNRHRLHLELDLVRVDPGDVDEIVHETREVGHLTVDPRMGPADRAVERRLLGQPPPQHLQAGHDRRQRIAELMAQHGDELVLVPIGLGQPIPLAPEDLLVPAHPLLDQRALVLATLVLAQLFGLPGDLLGPSLQVDEHAGLRLHDLGDDRLEQEIDRTQLVGGQDVLLVAAVGGHEDDGRMAGPLSLADQPRGLEAAQRRHVHVEHDQGEVAIEQQPQSAPPLTARAPRVRLDRREPSPSPGDWPDRHRRSGCRRPWRPCFQS